MNYSARHAVLFFITLGLAGAQIYSGDAQIYSGDLLANDIPIRVNLSESFIYYTAAQDTLFVSHQKNIDYEDELILHRFIVCSVSLL